MEKISPRITTHKLHLIHKTIHNTHANFYNKQVHRSQRRSPSHLCPPHISPGPVTPTIIGGRLRGGGVCAFPAGVAQLPVLIFGLSLGDPAARLGLRLLKHRRVLQRADDDGGAAPRRSRAWGRTDAHVISGQPNSASRLEPSEPGAQDRHMRARAPRNNPGMENVPQKKLAAARMRLSRTVMLF